MSRATDRMFTFHMITMFPLMVLLFATLADLMANKFGLTLNALVWLLPSAVVSFYAIRKLVYLETKEDEA
jgi:dolichyl-phosphate-mannose--protein O-mannosyl transferase